MVALDTLTTSSGVVDLAGIKNDFYTHEIKIEDIYNNNIIISSSI